MQFDDYKVVLYRQQDGSWVAEIPAISGCYALLPKRLEPAFGYDSQLQGLKPRMLGFRFGTAKAVP